VVCCGTVTTTVSSLPPHEAIRTAVDAMAASRTHEVAFMNFLPVYAAAIDLYRLPNRLLKLGAGNRVECS
jgi:hypothetical protein